MDIGEMQKRLSLKAEQRPDHRFDDLFSLICREDWLMLAHDHVASNAGSETAGCDGINMRTFDEDLEGNLKDLREALKKGTFRPGAVASVPRFFEDSRRFRPWNPSTRPISFNAPTGSVPIDARWTPSTMPAGICKRA